MMHFARMGLWRSKDEEWCLKGVWGGGRGSEFTEVGDVDRGLLRQTCTFLMDRGRPPVMLWSCNVVKCPILL